MSTPNIDTKALRDTLAAIDKCERDLCAMKKIEGSENSQLHIEMHKRKLERKLLDAAPALLDAAEERDRLRKEMYEVWKYALGCDCVPESAYTCRACAIDYPASDVVGELRRARDDSDELWEIVSGVIPDWNNREDEGETKKDRLHSIVAERDALKAEVERLTAEREDLLKSRARVVAERNEQSGLRDKLIERLTASDETWSEALGNERKLRDASEREAERLREALAPAAELLECFDSEDLVSPSMSAKIAAVVAALRGEEASRG
jgi:hypothetical protein